MLDKFKDECGVFGIFGHPEAANLTYLGLYALQHRGQESAGIAASDGTAVRISKAMGHVADAFSEKTLEKLPGSIAIGHVRYSTAGDSNVDNAQPILIDCTHGQIAIGHNGNIVNAIELKDELVKRGSIFQTSTDTEVILHLYARSRARFDRRSARGGDFPCSRSVFAGVDDEGSPDRGARSSWLSTTCAWTFG
jgi:amidophosphoribosyltransferase